MYHILAVQLCVWTLCMQERKGGSHCQTSSEFKCPHFQWCRLNDSILWWVWHLHNVYTFHKALLLCLGVGGIPALSLIQLPYLKGFPCSSGCRDVHSASKAAKALGVRSKLRSKSQVTHSPRKYGNSWADSQSQLLSKHYLSQTPPNSAALQREIWWIWC